ncbi:hypothetical protein D1157_21090, partial [Anaerotruncus sp. X29]|nr:hypothetical protein [Anaerotruncus sp. X29]
MADNEVSKIMWVAIVVALASSVFVIAKPEVTKQTSGVFDKVTQVVKGTNLDGKPAEGGETEVIKGINIVPNSAHAPNSNVNTPGKPVVTDPSKYVETGTADFGVSENNMWGIDANGNMYVWSTDDKPITGNIQGAGLGELMQRANRGDVKTLT